MKHLHLVDVYRMTGAVSTRGRRTAATVAEPAERTGVRCTVTQATGRLTTRTWGREPTGEWIGYFPARGYRPKKDDRIYIREGPNAGTRLRVTWTHELGDGWDTECELDIATEDFG